MVAVRVTANPPASGDGLPYLLPKIGTSRDDDLGRGIEHALGADQVRLRSLFPPPCCNFLQLDT